MKAISDKILGKAKATDPLTRPISIFTLLLVGSILQVPIHSLEIPESSSHRSLLSSFDEFNKIFENASIEIPEQFEVSERVAIADLDMTIRNIKCHDISVGNIVVDHQVESATTHLVNVGIANLGLTCQMDYDYTYGILSGDGWVQIETENSDVTSTVAFTSIDFNRDNPPTDSVIQSCFSDVEIKNMDFEEDFASEVLEVFQGLIRNTVEKSIGDVACEELSVVGTNVVGNMVEMAANQLEPYLGHLGDADTDPLYLEHNLAMPTNFKPLNLQDTEGHIGKTFDEILQYFDTYLGVTVADSSNNNLSTGNDLLINSLLRSFFLSDDGSLKVDPSSMSAVIDPILFEGHDQVIEFTITLNEVRLYGLDTIKRFNSFRKIGKHTIQNELTWDELTFEFDIALDMKPSSLEDAILIDPTSSGIKEDFTIDFTVNNVDVEASLLLLLDEDAMGSMGLGPLFYRENILPCVLSVVQRVELSGLDVDPSYINNGPAVNGLLSSGFDQLISDSVEAAFTMYKGSLRTAIPNIFQTEVRQLINSFIIDTYVGDETNSICPEVQPWGKGFVDFRKFFNPEDDTYGDLVPMMKEKLDEELLSVNIDTGRPRINEALIGPFTGAQSGTKGTLLFPFDLSSFLVSNTTAQSLGMESIELRLFNPTIENLDTFGAPIKVMEPNATNGQFLDNHAMLGSDTRKLKIGLKALVAADGDPNFSMNNEVDLSVEFSGSNAWISLLANVDAAKLFNFPLRDITNRHCWLNVFQIPESKIDADLLGFSIIDALISTELMNFDVSCDKCTSSSLDVLPEILDALESFGVSDVLERRLVTLLLEFVGSDYIQTSVNEILIDASLRCPHSSKFSSSPQSSSVTKVQGFPNLNYQTLETITFASTVGFEIAMIVMSKAHESYDLETSRPLSAQDDLSIESEIELVDFTSLEASVGKWASSTVDNFVSFLNEIVDDPNSNGDRGELRVNKLIRSSLLDKNGSLAIIFDNAHTSMSALGISLKEVNIFGLDSISKLNVIDAIGAQTIQNYVRWESIRFQAVLTLTDTQNETPSQKEEISISFGLSGVDLSLAFFIAVNLDRLQSLELWSIMEIKKILPCIMSVAHDASFTELEVSVGSFTEFSINGFNSSDVAAAASDSTRIILEEYEDTILSSIPKLFDSTIRNLVNNWLAYYKNAVPSGLCAHSPSENFGFVDLRDLLRSVDIARQLGGSGLSQYGDMFRAALQFAENVLKIDELTGLSGVNDVAIGPLTELRSNKTGTLFYPGDILRGEEKVQVGALNTNVQFRAYDAKIENLNTIGAPLEFFGGVSGEPYVLNNTFTAGAGQQPLRFSSKVLLSMEGDDNIEISNEIDLSLELTAASVMVSTMTKIFESNLFGFPLRDVFNLNCWLATIPAPSLDSRGVRIGDSELTASLAGLHASVGEVVVSAKCTNCSSPRMAELTELLSSPVTRNETTDVTNDLLAYVTQLSGGNFLQVQIDRALNNAAQKCPHNPLFDPDAEPITYDAFEAPNTSYSMGYLIVLGALVLTAVIVILIIILFVKWVVRRRHRKWLAKLPPHQMKSLASEQRNNMDLEARLNSTTSSMFRSPFVPCTVRLIMPLVIIGNILFFLSGHLSLGATVNIEAEVAGEKFTIEKFFEFSMARSTIDIWKAGGRELAVLILIFSGIWPYTKLLMTMWLWFASPSTVSVSRRGSILIWLDWLAKWSMIDIFVLVISIAAFRVSIESPDASYLPDDFYAIEMMVVPLWGLYANMIAQLLSQITSHVIIYYHRKIVTQAARSKDNQIQNAAHRHHDDERRGQDPESQHSVAFGEDQSRSCASFEDISFERSPTLSDSENVNEEAITLSKYQFSRPHRGETEKLVVRRYVNKMLPVCGFLLMVCIIVGCSLPSFSLEFFGLVGVAVEFGQDFEEATVKHSVFSVLKLLFDQAGFLGTVRDYLGLIVLSILFVSTILLVPIIQSVMLLRQWFSTTTVLQKQRAAVRLEILQAWQYLEVYLVALFVSSWQLGPISESMINTYCENLEDTFAQMVYFGLLKEQDAQCFSVVSRIEKCTFLLVGGSVLLSFLNSFVCKATFQYLRDSTSFEPHTKGGEQGNISLSTATFDSDDGNDLPESGIDLNIEPVPVLFTDTFRWLLKGSNAIVSSARAMFADPNNSHWSLPEATVVSADSICSDDQVIKGTYVSNMTPNRNIDLQKRHKSNELENSKTAKGSFSPRAKRLDSNDTMEVEQPYKRSSRRGRLKRDQSDSSGSIAQRSINSRMDSWDSSSIPEPNESHSLPSSMSGNLSLRHSPSSEDRTLPESPRSFRKPPPPSQYRLSSKSLKKPPPSHLGTVDMKKPPPDSASSRRNSARFITTDDDYTHASALSDYGDPTVFVDDDDEYSTVRTIEDIIREVDGADENGDGKSLAQHSTSYRQIT